MDYTEEEWKGASSDVNDIARELMELEDQNI